jgi:hypothetical protein
MEAPSLSSMARSLEIGSLATQRVAGTGVLNEVQEWWIVDRGSWIVDRGSEILPAELCRTWMC